MATLKANRKIAKFYGANALTGTKKQKEWAEQIRADVLSSGLLSDEQKAEFLSCATFLKTSKFWINNRELDASYFTKENLYREFQALLDLREKHYDTLLRTRPTSDKNRAKGEIKAQLIENKFQLGRFVSFPNFEPVDVRGIFKK